MGVPTRHVARSHRVLVKLQSSSFKNISPFVSSKMLTGLMSPIRGRAARYCHRIQTVRRLARLVIHLNNRACGGRAYGQVYFSGAVHYLTEALRGLAFASAIDSPASIEQRSRFLTPHCHGSYILNTLEFSNPGAFPWPVAEATRTSPYYSLQQFLGKLEYRTENVMTPDVFIWSWRACKYARTSVNVRSAWGEVAGGITPKAIASSIISLLECHLINLYRRGLAWLVIFPSCSSRPSAIPVFSKGSQKIKSKFSRNKRNGRLFFQTRYRESRVWPALVPSMKNWDLV